MKGEGYAKLGRRGKRYTVDVDLEMVQFVQGDGMGAGCRAGREAAERAVGERQRQAGWEGRGER